MNADQIVIGMLWYVVFVISLTFHEAAHAFAAMKLGDKTAYHGGQVSLHPFAHIQREPIGMVVFPILTFFLNGWMMGWASTPYDPEWARRYPKRDILMSAAGPAANLLLVIIAAIIIRVGMSLGYFYAPDTITSTQVTAATKSGMVNSIALMVSILFTLNLILFLFNLLPLPPLDGSGLVPLFLQGEVLHKYKELVTHPTYQIIGLVIAWQGFKYVYYPIHTLALNLLYPGANYG
jgi:Zn-dependent protease